MDSSPVTPTRMTRFSDSESTAKVSVVSLWLLRVATLASGITVPLLADRLDRISTASSLLAITSLWITWAAVLLCVLVPSSVSLTAIRLIAPGHLAVTAVVAVGALIDDVDAVHVVAIVPTLLTTIVAMSADVGSNFVQSSAYGDEFRVPLLPPPAFALVLVLGWIIWIASLLVGALALTHEAWIAGGLLIACGALLSWFLPSRFHRFSRRWLVVVPAGLVLHDHVVLAETAMFTRTSIRSIDIARGHVDTADLSGGAHGRGIAVELADFDTVVLAATSNRPGGSALHVKSWWVRPSRPGRLISAWARPVRRPSSS